MPRPIGHRGRAYEIPFQAILHIRERQSKVLSDKELVCDLQLHCY